MHCVGLPPGACMQLLQHKGISPDSCLSPAAGSQQLMFFTRESPPFQGVELGLCYLPVCPHQLSCLSCFLQAQSESLTEWL